VSQRHVYIDTRPGTGTALSPPADVEDYRIWLLRRYYAGRGPEQQLAGRKVYVSRGGAHQVIAAALHAARAGARITILGPHRAAAAAALRQIAGGIGE